MLALNAALQNKSEFKFLHPKIKSTSISLINPNYALDVVLQEKLNFKLLHAIVWCTSKFLISVIHYAITP